MIKQFKTREGKTIKFLKSAHPDKFFLAEYSEKGTLQHKKLKHIKDINNIEAFLIDMGAKTVN